MAMYARLCKQCIYIDSTTPKSGILNGTDDDEVQLVIAVGETTTADEAVQLLFYAHPGSEGSKVLQTSLRALADALQANTDPEKGVVLKLGGLLGKLQHHG